MRRIEQYQVSRGDNIADPGFWNPRLQDIDDRINNVEAYSTSLDGAVQNVEALGVERVNATLNPLVAQALAKITSVANLLEAGSASSVAIVASGQVSFTIAESDRAIWPLPAFVSASLVTDPTKYMAGRVVSFDRTTGVLVIDVMDHGGAGTYASWVVRLSGMPGAKGDTGLQGVKGDTGSLSGNASNLAATAPSGFTGANVQDVLASLAAILSAAVAVNTGQDAAIAGKAPVYHTHMEGDISGLVADLASKATVGQLAGKVAKSGDVMSGQLTTVGLAHTKSVQLAGPVDFNTLVTAGFYDLASEGSSNGPPSTSTWWYLAVQRHSNTDLWATQTATALVPGDGLIHAWQRIRENGTWGAWQQIVSAGVATTFTKHQGFGIKDLTDAATIAWDVSGAQAARVTLGGNRTLEAPTNAIEGFTYVLIAKQDATGGHTLAFAEGAFLWPDDTAPVIATGPNKKTILTFIYEGGVMNGVPSLNY